MIQSLNPGDTGRFTVIFGRNGSLIDPFDVQDVLIRDPLGVLRATTTPTRESLGRYYVDYTVAVGETQLGTWQHIWEWTAIAGMAADTTSFGFVLVLRAPVVAAPVITRVLDNEDGDSLAVYFTPAPGAIHNLIYADAKIPADSWMAMSGVSSPAQVTGLKEGHYYNVILFAENADGYWSLPSKQVMGRITKGL